MEIQKEETQMKKFVALLLALAMVFALAACSNSNSDNQVSEPTEAPAADNQPAAEPTEEPEAPTYTYDTNLTEFPTLWNPHTYQTSTSSSIMSYVSDSLYSFDYNEDETGFAIVPSMAAEEPIDITADYVGQYGIAEGDTARVWKMVLRQDLAWEDGTPINANSFVESAKRLLDPVAKNFRGDSLYSGSVQIWNAESYMKQGRYAYGNLLAAASSDDLSLYYTDDAFVANEAGQLTVNGGDVWFGPDMGSNWSSNPLGLYYEYGYFNEANAQLWNDVIVANTNESGYVPVTEEVKAVLQNIVAQLHEYADVEAYAAAEGDYAYVEWQECCFLGQNYAAMDFSEVGIFALSDYELVYVLINPSSGFELKYGMPDGYLVYTELYDSLASVDEEGLYTNTYGTSAETTKSYGPYIMKSFQADKEIHYVRNDNFYDVKDGYYQCTDVVIHCVPEAATRLQMLISGELDTYGLQQEDMSTYLMSDYTYLSESASIWGMVFNPSKEALEKTQAAAGENKNKTILTLIEFRQAMCYGMNRTEFSLATMPTCLPAFGLMSNQHIVDVEAGLGYRSTDIAKQVLAEVWDVADDIGEGKLYADLDEAVNAITGYNPDLAKQKFDEAYDRAIAEGLMDEDDVVELCIGLPTATSSIYNNGYEFIINNYQELVKGTKLEGKLTFTRDDTIGDNFSNALKDNQVDMLFYVGFSGSELDPFNLMEVYIDGGNLQYDPCVDYQTVDLTIELDGTAWTTSVYNWQRIMNGIPCVIVDAEGNTKEFSCGSADNDPETRLQILGNFERAVLLNYDFIPLSGDSSAQLVGQQVQYHSDEYMYGVGFGGLRYMTFNYSDAEWAEYVASQNGELDYT